jgi:hypothetical protein
MRAHFQSRRGQRQTPKALVVLLCVLLMLFVGATQALHIHASDEAANPGCSLCAVAHVTAIPVPVLAAPVIAESVGHVVSPDSAEVPLRFFSFNLYVRPPPSLTTHT